MKSLIGRSVLLSAALAGLVTQTTRAQNASPPATTEQKSAADVAKELDAMKQRIQQLEGELKKTQEAPAAETAKAPASATPATETAKTPLTPLPAAATSAEASPTLPADLASSVPILPPSLRTPDGKALDAKATRSLGELPSLIPQAPVALSPQAAAAQPPAAPAAPPPVDLDTPFAFADFSWMLSNP